jgi:hypothetical protein
MEWRHNGSPRPAPRNSEFKKPLEKFLPRFFGIKTASCSLIIFQRANYQRGVLLISAAVIKGHEGKTPALEMSPKES